MRPRRTSRVLALFLLAAVAASASAAIVASLDGPPAAEPKLRTLVVLVDGVPHSVADSLHRAGHFPSYHRPSKVISPFPSLTGVSFPRMLGAAPPPGYEDRYFDRGANRIRGGLMQHLLEPAEHAGFRRMVDIETSGTVATVGYLFPEALVGAELEALEEEIDELATTEATIVAYLVSTDALAHRLGRSAVVNAMLELEAMLDRLRERYGEELRVAVFSDHGSNFVTSRRAPIEDSLVSAGFRLERAIHEPNDVVVPRFGLVGSSFLYSAASAEPRLAEHLTDVPGVDLVMYEDEAGTVHVLDRAGRATITHREADDGYRYRPVTGDPLELEPALRRMRDAGELDDDGFASDSAWLRATLDGRYIDPLRRIVRGMRDVVRHPASVVVSFAPGYYHGDPAADLLVDVAGTHGSLRTASSLAFFMDTHEEAPAVMRAAALRAHLPGRW
ncbi:MAG: hypothetical protein ACODAE_04290 [Gemmatimonadota bacterium]